MTTELISSHGSLQASKEILLGDLKRVVGDADDLVKQVVSSSADEFAARRAAIEARLAEARSRINDLRTSAARSVCKAADAANGYVRENPWKAIGCGAVAGIIVALLISRRE